MKLALYFGRSKKEDSIQSKLCIGGDTCMFRLFTAALVIFSVVQGASAGYVFELSFEDSEEPWRAPYQMSHEDWYEWGFEIEIPDGYVVTEATVEFDLIRNFKSPEFPGGENALFVNLLPEGTVGVTVGEDDGNPELLENYFEGQGVYITEWQNLSNVKTSISYDFSEDQVLALNDMAQNGFFALAVDPDCHYFLHGGRVKVSVPEPSSLSLLLIGSLGLFAAAFTRKKNRKDAKKD